MEKSKLITVQCSGLFCSIYFESWYGITKNVLQQDYSKTVCDNVIILVAYHSFFSYFLGRRMENLYPSFYNLLVA